MNTFIFSADTKDVIVARLLNFLDRWPERQPCEISVKRYVHKRSLEQNAALFGLAYKILSDETGHSMDELHDFFCRKVFGVHEFDVLGEARSRPLRTTTTNEQGRRDVLPWDRFADFFSFVQHFAAQELMIEIPDPDPKWKERARKEGRLMGALAKAETE